MRRDEVHIAAFRSSRAIELYAKIRGVRDDAEPRDLNSGRRFPHDVAPASLPLSARRLLLAISGMATGFGKNDMLCANLLCLNIAVPNTRMIFL
jgi:hypothetical protein